MTKETKERFFRSSAAFRKWLEKNHDSKSEIWLGFYKGIYKDQAILYKEATDLCLCYGWALRKIKRIDEQTYKVEFRKRRPRSCWSLNSINRFKELRKSKLVHSSGITAFSNRDKEGSEEKLAEFSLIQLKQFKSNKKAWAFFIQQTKSYQRQTTHWVTIAKRAETQDKRLKELIRDSSNNSKLLRIIKAQEKVKPKYKPGATPIEVAKNIGPVSGGELRSVGIETLEKLKILGWEEAFTKLYEIHPHRLSLNMLTSLIGAVEDQKWNTLEPHLKAEAKQHLRNIKRGLEDF